MRPNTLPVHPTLRHPSTGEPFQAIWVRPDGRIMWPILGGSEPPPEPTPPAPAPPTPSAPPPRPTPPAPPAPAPDPVRDVDALPEWAQKQIRDLRKESGDRRAQATTAEQQRTELLDNMAKALGLKPNDTPPDPAELQKTLGERETRVTTLEQDLRSRDIELSAWRVAAQQGVNALALMDSRTFLRELTHLDPAADDFVTKLDDAVKKTVKANPTLRNTVVPAGAAGIGSVGSSTGVSIGDSSGRDLLRSAYKTD